MVGIHSRSDPLIMWWDEGLLELGVSARNRDLMETSDSPYRRLSLVQEVWSVSPGCTLMTCPTCVWWKMPWRER